MSKWFCVTVFWKTGEVQTIWIKDEKIAQGVFNHIRGLGGFDRIKLSSEEASDEKH